MKERTIIKIAIIEDDDIAAKNLCDSLKEYEHCKSVSFVIKRYTEADTFLAEYTFTYDLVFLDIELPGENGMNAAFKLRKIDPNVIIIFVTNMVQYAVQGYEVEALDYIVKPVDNERFSVKLDRALKLLQKNTCINIRISQADGIQIVALKDILYVEVAGHKVAYHTLKAIYSEYISLRTREAVLRDYGFLRCNNYCLVNPKYIDAVHGFSLQIRGGEILQISHPRRKQFMQELSNWLGEGNL